MKKIIIFCLLFFSWINISFWMTYSEKTILSEIYYKKAVISKSYKDELSCRLWKKIYNKKFPNYYRGNCFYREKDSNYYYFIYEIKNTIDKKFNNIQIKKTKKNDNNNSNSNFYKNSFWWKYIDLKNINKFNYLLKYLNNKKNINFWEPKIEIVNWKLYFLNIFIDIDFIQAFEKNIYNPIILDYYNLHSYEIKKYLDIYRKQKTCKFSITKSNKKILSYLYSNNIFIRTDDLSKDIACYIYQNKANYFVRELCTTYKPYRKTNITKWLYSLKLTYPIWKSKMQISTLYWLFSNWVKYVDWLALKNEKWKVKTFKVKWWWLCWVSTILYNFNLSQKKLFDINERWPHMWYYRWYYGPIIWIDATIFWPTKNYKFTNISDEDIIWDYFSYKKWWKFCYWIKAWKLRPFPSQTKISSKRYKRNCYKNIVYDSKTWKVLYTKNSCYKEIN
jgi:hypothetical protein